MPEFKVLLSENFYQSFLCFSSFSNWLLFPNIKHSFPYRGTFPEKEKRNWSELSQIDDLPIPEEPQCQIYISLCLVWEKSSHRLSLFALPYMEREHNVYLFFFWPHHLHDLTDNRRAILEICKIWEQSKNQILQRRPHHNKFLRTAMNFAGKKLCGELQFVFFIQKNSPRTQQ